MKALMILFRRELALAWSDLAGTRKRGPVLGMTGPWRAPLTHLP